MNRVEAHIHIGRKRRGLSDCMSVRDLPGGQVHYETTMFLEDVKFAVQPAGLRRLRETGQKNVHAFVRGTPSYRWSDGYPWREVRYNPSVNDTFVDAEFGFPVHRADFVFFDGERLYYMNTK